MTGWSFMDEDHRYFVEIINDLHRAARVGAGAAALPPALADLISLFTAHFDKEETAMRQSRYALLSDHKMQHDLMRVKLRVFVHALDAGQHVTVTDVIEFLRGWLVEHIRRHDRDLARHLAKRAAVGRYD